jgi:glutamate synthase domain-containing protein 2
MLGWLHTLDRHFPNHFRALGVHDLLQRFLLEWIRPELRQQHAKGESEQCVFGSQRDVQATGHDFRVRIGSAASCIQPYHVSVFNISAMSVDALSAHAILALNGGDLIWEIGSTYSGCCDEQGHFDPIRFAEQAAEPQVKMIEIKLSQEGISSASHSAFGTPIELVLFIERLRRLSGGKPVGIKLCVVHTWEWFALVKAMLHTHVAPDFIVVDGSEGGTGAAPSEFADPIGMPLQESLRLVHDTLVGTGLRDRIRIGFAGKVVSAFDIARAMALGADWCNSARGFMFALGCIQAQDHHTGDYPTGVATQDKLRQHAIGSLADGLVDLTPGAVLAAERGEGAWPDEVFARDWPRARFDSFSPALQPSLQASLGTEHPVAGVAQARHDVAVLVELAVDGRGVDRHVGVVGVEVRQALGR